MKLGWQPRKWLEKKAKHGLRGYPVGTVAFYGPDDRKATKVAAGIIAEPDAEPEMRRWLSEGSDVRTDAILGEVATFFREHEVRSVAINVHEAGRTFEPKAASPTPGAGDFCLVTLRPIEEIVAHLGGLGIAIEVGPVPRHGAEGP